MHTALRKLSQRSENVPWYPVHTVMNNNLERCQLDTTRVRSIREHPNHPVEETRKIGPDGEMTEVWEKRLSSHYRVEGRGGKGPVRAFHGEICHA